MAMDDFDWDAYLKGMGAPPDSSPVASSKEAPARQEPPDVTQPNVPLQAAAPPSIPDKVPGAPAPIKLPPPPKADISDPNLEAFKQQQAGQPPPQSGANAAGGAASDAISAAIMIF
jgi:hypothetical protein